MIDGDPEELVLGLLANTPTSFAALFGLVSRESRRRLSVTDLFDLIGHYEAKGWVRFLQLTDDGNFRGATPQDCASAIARYTEWLDRATEGELIAEELSLDEIGLWIEITAQGKREFETAQTDGEHDRWTLDQDDRLRTVTIRAQDIDTANRIASGWEARNPTLYVVQGSRLIDLSVEDDRDDTLRGRQPVRLRFGYGSREQTR